MPNVTLSGVSLVGLLSVCQLPLICFSVPHPRCCHESHRLVSCRLGSVDFLAIGFMLGLAECLVDLPAVVWSAKDLISNFY